MLRRAILAVLLCATLGAGEVYDRIAVTVGNRVITESAVILDLRVSAFLDRVLVNLGPEKKREAAERLVDQMLILRDATESHLTLPTAQNVGSLLEQLKAQFGSPQEYEAALRQYRIQERDITAQLVSGLVALTFTDLRFRPGIQVTEDELRAYYDTVQDASTFEAAREEIENLIARQRETDALDKWLAEARANERIEFREQVFR
jgi:hypothetical protein